MTVKIEIETPTAEQARHEMASLLGSPTFTVKEPVGGDMTQPGVVVSLKSLPTVQAESPPAPPAAAPETKRKPGRPRRDATPAPDPNAPEPADGAGVSVQADPSSAAELAAASTPQNTTAPDAPPASGESVTVADPAAPTHEDARAALGLLNAAKGMPIAKALVARYVEGVKDDKGVQVKPQLSNIPAEKLVAFIADCKAPPADLGAA